MSDFALEYTGPITPHDDVTARCPDCGQIKNFVFGCLHNTYRRCYNADEMQARSLWYKARGYPDSARRLMKIYQAMTEAA